MIGRVCYRLATDDAPGEPSLLEQSGSGDVPDVLFVEEPAYLARQLAAFKAGLRRDATDGMNSVAATLRDDEMPAITRHLASLSP